MGCPTRVAIGALSAIAIGTPVAQAGEFNPPADLQTVPTQDRIVITPPANSVVVPVVSTDAGVVPQQPSVTRAGTVVEATAQPTVGSGLVETAEVEPKRFSDTTIASDLESPAAGLGSAVTIDSQSAKSNCPLKTQMVAMTPDQIAQATTTGPCARPAPVEALVLPQPYQSEASPALSIYIPVGFGLDGWSVWGSGGYQAGVREDTGSVGGGGIGVGLGDAKKLVGLELGYTFVDGDTFGTGGFSGKLHKRFSDLSLAFGWNGFLNPTRNDFEQSIYGVATYVFRFADSLDSLFSRLAVSVGAGNGQFRSNLDRDEFQNGTNVFGGFSLRIARPVSLLAEWTGQDLAVGLSIAPFKNFPFVITPAVRDVTGSGYAPRFVLGAGVSFKF